MRLHRDGSASEVARRQIRHVALAVVAGLALLAGTARADNPVAIVPPDPNVLPIDLLTVLRLSDANNPTIALARQRVQEALAVQAQAEVLWLPNLWVGGNPRSPSFLPTYYGHFGEIQDAGGRVSPAFRNAFSFPAGLGLDVDTGVAIFAPLVTRRLGNAVAAQSRAVSNNVQLEAVLTYFDLLRAYNRLAILAETLTNAEAMRSFAEAAEKAGTGKTAADATRAQAEVLSRRQEQQDLRRQALRISAHLAELLLLQPTLDLRPADPTVVPVRLIDPRCTMDELVTTGLLNRPELLRDREQVAAALERRKQARLEPFLPIVSIFSLDGVFGGGGSARPPIENVVGNRVDIQAQAAWQLRNLGYGNRGTVREREAQYAQANLSVVETGARVAAEVTTAAQDVRVLEDTIAVAEAAVKAAAETFRRLERARFGLAGPDRRYDPLEGLTAEQSLNDIRNRYLDTLIGYNQAQFRLYTAIGQPPLQAIPRSDPPLAGSPLAPSVASPAKAP
jgi:outer membrane protein TolC